VFRVPMRDCVGPALPVLLICLFFVYLRREAKRR
jgi:hypothetical protein